MKRGKNIKPSTLRVKMRAFHNVIDGVLLDFLAGNRRISPAYTGKKQSEVLIYLSRRSYGRTWIACNGLLFNGDSRWKSSDEITFRLAHSAKKLSCIGRQRLYISSLSFCIERVECQRGFTGTGNACNYNKSVTWNFDA